MGRLAVCLSVVLLATCGFGQDASSTQPQPSSQSDPLRKAASEQEARPNSSPAEKSEGDHRYHLRLGTISVGAGYFSGPLFYPYGPYGWYPYYSAAFWDPFWGTYSSFAYLPNLAYGHDKGEVRLATDPKQAEVYIDGAYAGTADHLKSMWLDPGAYDLSVSYTGRESFHQRIYILTGKSLKITAKLAAQSPSAGEKEEKQ